MQINKRGMSFLVLMTAMFLLLGTKSFSQTQQEIQNPGWNRTEAVPILTGYVGLGSTFKPGSRALSPTATPIVLVPFGERWLVEAEGEFENEFEYEDGAWRKTYGKELEYLQLDFLANKYMTVVAGRFLTPFGIYNERLHPGWIKNLQPSPIINPIATGSSNGVMLRGGIPLSRFVNLNYSSYFSAASTVRALGANRVAGTRFSLFFPGQRLEIGTSFQRQLMEERFNSYGMDWTWQLKKIPLDIRGEFARNSDQGSGYWLEGAYRMSRLPFAKNFMRKSQAVMRFEQFIAPDVAPAGGAGAGGHDAELPAVDTQLYTFGWNYYIRPDVRLAASYGRSFNSERDQNIWSLAVTYRFSVPIGGK